MKKNKKFMAAICALALILQVGCSASTADTSSASAKKSDTSSVDTEKSQLEEQVKNLAEVLSAYTGQDTDSILNGSATIESDIHDIYDDTAVVNAYKSGDSSALTDEKDKYILDEATKAIKEIITDEMSDYDKELAVYDYIFSKTHFDDGSLAAIDSSSDYSHTPYGFFRDHTTICVGNATTFKLFMDMLGIDCGIIHSTEQGEHAWNQVKIDGEWYNVDVTFDGGVSTPIYSRFNVTDAIKESDGYPWDYEDGHACTATKDNYWLKNAADCEDVYSIAKMLKEAITDGKEAVFLKLDIPDNADADIFGAQLQNVVDNIKSDSYYFSSGGIIASDDGKSVVLQISFSALDGTDDNFTSDLQKADIDYDKLSKSFTDEFSNDIKLSEDISSTEESGIYSYIYEYTTTDDEVTGYSE